MKNKKDGLIKLTGLWERKSKDGKVYYSGNLSTTAKVLLFKNDNKKNDRGPDLALYLAPLGKRLQLEKPVEHEEDIEPF